MYSEFDHLVDDGDEWAFFSIYGSDTVLVHVECTRQYVCSAIGEVHACTLHTSICI